MKKWAKEKTKMIDLGQITDWPMDFVLIYQSAYLIQKSVIIA